VSVSQWQ